MAQRAEYGQVGIVPSEKLRDPGSFHVPDASQGLETFAHAAFAIGNRMNDALDEQVKNESALSGAVAGRDPNFTPQRENTIAAQAYNKAAMNVYLSNVEIDAHKNIDILSTQYKGDPAGLQKALDAYSSGVAKSIDKSMPELSQPFKESFYRNSNAVIRSAFAQQTDVLRNEQQAAFTLYADNAVNSAQRMARNVAMNPGNAADLALERQRFIDRMIEHGPAQGFEFAGQKAATDPTRPGALSPERMAELLNKYDDTVYKHTVLGRFDQAPNKTKFMDDFIKSEKGDTKSPLSLEQVESIAADMRSQISHDQTEKRLWIAGAEEDQKSMYLHGIDPPSPIARKDYVEAYGPERGERKFQDMQTYRGLGRNIKLVSSMDLTQQQDLVERTKPQPGEGFATKQQAQDVLIKAIQHVNTERVKDPIAFAGQNNIANVQPLDFSKPEDFRGELRKRSVIGSEMATKYGTGYKLLSNGEAEGMSRSIDMMPTQNAIGFLQEVRRGTPDDNSYLAIMRQLAPHSPVTAIAGDISNTKANLIVERRTFGADVTLKNTDVAGMILEGERLINPDKVLKTEAGKTTRFPMPSDDKLRITFNSVVGNAFQGHPEAYDAMWQSAKAYYASDAARSSDYQGHQSADYDDRMRRATTAVTGGILEWNGNKIVPPWGMNESSFTNQLASRWPQVVADTGLPQDYAKRLRAFGLTNYGQNSYMVMSGTQPLVGKDKRPVIIDMSPADIPEAPQ